MSAQVDVLAVLRRDATDATRLRSQQDLEYARRRAAESVIAIATVAELIEQRDTLLNALKRALPHVEHAYHTHEDLDGSFWIDVVGCRNAIASVQGVQS